MKKYRMFFGWGKTALIALVILAGAAIVVMDAVMISGAAERFTTANKTVAAVSLAAGAIVAAAAALLLFNSYYVCRDDELYIMFGFFADKVPYSSVFRIAVNAENKEVFIAYKGEKNDAVKVRVNLTPDKSAAFLAELEKKCAFAAVDTFIPPSDKNTNKES